MKKKLHWEIWQNPIVKMMEDMGADDDLDDEFSEQENSNGGNLKMFSTPFGIFPIKDTIENGNPFNFWVAHTNFNITKDTVNKICHVPGIESLSVFSPYRFRIGVAKLFDVSQVKHNLQKALNIIVSKPIEEAQIAIDNISNHKHWAVLVLPNKHINCCFSDKEDDNSYKLTLSSYRKASDGVGGAELYTSDEYSNI